MGQKRCSLLDLSRKHFCNNSDETMPSEAKLQKDPGVYEIGKDGNLVIPKLHRLCQVVNNAKKQIKCSGCPER
jgi:hypothetical protein